VPGNYSFDIGPVTAPATLEIRWVGEWSGVEQTFTTRAIVRLNERAVLTFPWVAVTAHAALLLRFRLSMVGSLGRQVTACAEGAYSLGCSGSAGR
jgi:hypothetical protein